MKRFLYLFIYFILLFNKESIAQNIEVTVLDKNSQPMPYAYILVNGKVMEITNSQGVSTIPINKLTQDDTISVSYLGASKAWVIYDQNLKESKKQCFYLDESDYILDEVVVIYQDIEKLFKKNVKNISAIDYNCTMNALFKAKLSTPDQIVYPVSGTLTAENELWSKKFIPREYGWFHRPLRFITNSDTSKNSRLLNFHTHIALNFVNFSLAICHLGNIGKVKPAYSYLGEKDNYKVFRISYPQTYIVGYYYQIILYVDKMTKAIQSIEIQAVNSEFIKNRYLNKFNIKAECELFTNKKPRQETVYLPINLNYNAQMLDGSLVEISISNVSINYKEF